VVVMIMLAFAFIPAAFALFVVRERETKAKHLQVRPALPTLPPRGDRG
jgi:hypothetical protein